MNTIKIYRVNDDYGFFSNFSKHPIYYMGPWKTAEHCFQAMKFFGTSFENESLIARCETPFEASKLGRSLSPIRKDWENIKVDLMYEIVKAKFVQNGKIRETLISTEQSIIIEHTKNDCFWGDGGDGSGENILGKTLMKVREQLAKEYKNICSYIPPWEKFPDYIESDLGWRMGAGESYLNEWTLWFSGLLEHEKNEYVKAYPKVAIKSKGC